MNELSKLMSSLLLLGAGFFAASFVGPPEVVDRLAHYLKPSGQADHDGLQPLPPRTTSDTAANPWPNLPGQPAPPVDALASDAFVPGPQADAEPISSRIAPVAARIASASWPSEGVQAAEPADWPSLGSPEAETAPAADPWLTAASQGIAPPATAQREVAPIPRGGQRAAEPASPAPPAEEAGWPTLLPPSAPRNAPPMPLTEPTTMTSLRPSLEENPYGDRPRFEPGPSAASVEYNPLRYEPLYPKTDAIQRQPVATQYGQHIVTDGDTLDRLAKQYLGDPGRAQELFELNSDRLEQPDVLPIGMVLRTPERPRRLPRPAAVPTQDGFPSLDGHDGFATLAASGTGQTLTRDPFPIERRPLTSASGDAESVRPAHQPTEPLYDHEVMWDPGRW